MEGTPAKENRNNELFELKQNGKTFADLAVYFGLSVWRAKEIYYRECQKRGIKPRKYERKQ